MKKIPNKYLIVVVGPTAVGKTALSVQLAKQLSTEILSADARQFYKNMPIGTGQPTQGEMQGIPHHFLAFLSIDQAYSAGKFEKEALAQLASMFNTHQYAILTGGSGLYVQAVCEGLIDLPSIDPMIRAKLNTLLQQEGLEYLVKLLEIKDLICYKHIDTKNPQRVIRALEVCEGTKRPYSILREKHNHIVKRPFKIIKIGLSCDKEKLNERIENRIDQMVAGGLFKEAMTLYDYRAHNALQTLGYQEIFDHLRSNASIEETITCIKHNTKKYAKRQLTWFRKDKVIHWCHPDNYNEIIRYIYSQITE